MNTFKKIICGGLVAASLPLAVSAQGDASELVAFPGAEGFGQFVTGGRGGKVYHVTTLEDNNEPGSLRYAINQSGPRTIVFDVDGTIYLNSELKIRNGDLTIAGQTAPGDGICLADFPVVLSAPNLIVRFMRFRLGNNNVDKHEGDGLGGMDGRDMIIDHCSVSWSVDECLSVYGSKNFTVQWCMVSHSMVNSGHSKGAHGYGGNWGGSGASYHHNLLAHHTSRTPRFGPRPSTQTDERMDYRNNVIYNWAGEGCYGGEGMNVNVVNNYYKPGPATTNVSRAKRIVALGVRTVDYCLDKNTTVAAYNKVAGTSVKSSSVTGGRDNKGNYVAMGLKKFYIDMEASTITVNDQPVKVTWNSWKPMLHVWAKMFVEGNYNPDYADFNEDNWNVGVFDQINKSGNDKTFDDAVKAQMVLASPIAFPATTTHSAQDAYERVVDYAGASLRRDAYDTMIADDVRNGVSSFHTDGLGDGFVNSQNDVVYADGSKGWPVLETAEAPVDTDGDGMPDAWETENGLDPANGEDGAQTAANGYTNLENYLNSLVAHIIEAQNAGGKVETSGINDIFEDATVAPADGRIYNLQGIQMTEPLAPGIYIRDGKKFVVK